MDLFITTKKKWSLIEVVSDKLKQTGTKLWISKYMDDKRTLQTWFNKDIFKKYEFVIQIFKSGFQ